MESEAEISSVADASGRPDASTPDEGSDVEAAKPRILAVTGAKGGVGKSVIAANLAVYLASIGRRVVLADADVGGANQHAILNVERPRPGRFFDPAVDEERQLPEGWPLQTTSVPHLFYYHAGLDEPPAGESRRRRQSKLEEDLRALDADYVVVDLGAGLSSALIDLYLSAELSLYVSVPEPPAVENTYRFLRYAFVRHLRHHVHEAEVRRELVGRLREMGGAPPPVDLWRRLEDDGDPLADVVRELMETFSPSLVLNQARVRTDLELGDAMRTAGLRRLGVRVDYIGHVDLDDTVWSCVRSRRLLLVESPGSKSAKTIEKLARRMLIREAGKRMPHALRTVPPESHHELLEVERGATEEEVRRAYKRVREIYSQNALCCYGLFDEQELRHLRGRLEEAYDVLLDPARRRPYELSVFPMDDDEEVFAPAPGEVRGSLPPAPEVGPDTDFSGDLLRAVRESQGVELKEISQRTKVGMAFLSALELDDFAALPAPVYVRGFVSEFAKCLGLDASQVSRTYVKRYRRYLDDRASGIV